MGRCVSPCLGDLDPNAYRRQLDRALALFDGPAPDGELLAEIDRRIEEASAERRYERAAALLRRRGRIQWVLERLEGILRATHAAPRLLLAPHPVKPRHDAFWIVRGRLVDWGPLPGHSELAERTRAALARLDGGARSPVPAAEVDELRIVWGWLADNEPPELALDPAPDEDALRDFVSGATGSAPRGTALSGGGTSPRGRTAPPAARRPPALPRA
jgi:DNA polymerase-3 subunit epsilon